MSLKEWINRENKPGTPLWKALLFEGRLPLRYLVLIRKLHYPKTNLVLRKLIKGKRVLIIGSGPSSKELKKIPKDVLIFTCNAGPKLLIDKKINRKIDFYTTSKPNIECTPLIADVMKKIKTNVLAFDILKYLKKNFKKNYSKLVYDLHKENFILKKLIYPNKVKDIIGSSYGWTSTGIRLLQFALHFKAKEIYMIGIDLNTSGYFYEKGKNRPVHIDIDNKFMKIITKNNNNNNIFSASKNSSIIKYIPHKELI